MRLVIFSAVLQIIGFIIVAIDWIAERFDRDEELHPFLREDYRPIQFTGRPRKDGDAAD